MLSLKSRFKRVKRPKFSSNFVHYKLTLKHYLHILLLFNYLQCGALLTKRSIYRLLFRPLWPPVRASSGKSPETSLKKIHYLVIKPFRPPVDVQVYCRMSLFCCEIPSKQMITSDVGHLADVYDVLLFCWGFFFFTGAFCTRAWHVCPKCIEKKNQNKSF